MKITRYVALKPTSSVIRENYCAEHWISTSTGTSVITYQEAHMEQLLKLSFSMFNQLLHSVSTHVSLVAQVQVIIFDSLK